LKSDTVVWALPRLVWMPLLFREAAPLMVPIDGVIWEPLAVVVRVDDDVDWAAPDVDVVLEAKRMLVMRES
jgi:hypothetical protein